MGSAQSSAGHEILDFVGGSLFDLPGRRRGTDSAGRIRVFSKPQRSKEMSVVLLTKCPKPFAGIGEHCSIDLSRVGASYQKIMKNKLWI
jgi:hypothetical protein